MKVLLLGLALVTGSSEPVEAPRIGDVRIVESHTERLTWKGWRRETVMRRDPICEERMWYLSRTNDGSYWSHVIELKNDP